MEDEAQHEFKSEERSPPLSSTTSRAFKLEKNLMHFVRDNRVFHNKRADDARRDDGAQLGLWTGSARSFRSMLPEQETLICSLATEGHRHTDACYAMESQWKCGQEETETHTHDDSCYGSVAVLVCSEEEREPHAHTDRRQRSQIPPQRPARIPPWNLPQNQRWK